MAGVSKSPAEPERNPAGDMTAGKTFFIQPD